MNNIKRLFIQDVFSLFKNAVSVVIVLGLVFLPSIFSWYNILACWNVFDNTGGLTVAVANSDEGYESDLMPIRVNIGESVESALRANDQLNWVFVSEEEAIDGVKSGTYYAAVVIPLSFSQDMMTFYSSEVRHAKIVYYTNEKESAVAPKVTDQGADRVSYQVNEVFVETLVEIGLDIAKGVQKYADENDVNGHIGSLLNTVDVAAGELEQSAKILRSYSAIISSAQALISSSSALIEQAQGSVDAVKQSAGNGQKDISTVSDAVQSAAGSLSDALQLANSAYDSIDRAIGNARSSGAELSERTSQDLRGEIERMDAQIAGEEEVIAQLRELAKTSDADLAARIDSLIARLESSLALQKSLRASLDTAATSIETGKGDADAQLAEAQQLASEAKAALSDVAGEYESSVKPKIEELASKVSMYAARIDANAQALRESAEAMTGAADSAVSQLAVAKAKLDSSADKLEAGSSKLKGFSGDLAAALKDNNIAQIKEVLGSDPSVLSSALAAPVELDRQAVFPADNFGTQMAPLYTVLALWIGSLLLVVAIKVGVSEETRKKLDNPTLSQIFIGRFGIFALLSLMQTTVMGLGNWLFLGVQVTYPFLFMLCFWFSGLVFTFIMYTFVVSFANLGKAFGVLLLILQVTSAGGSFPLQLLPSIFQVLSPYVPATHVINAMRAAMMGMYQNDFWIEMGELALFIVPMAILGLALRKPLIAFLNWYIARVEDSKLVN